MNVNIVWGEPERVHNACKCNSAQSVCDTVIVHFSGVLMHDLSQMSEDVKASCVSYGHTSTMHSRSLLHKLG